MRYAKLLLAAPLLLGMVACSSKKEEPIVEYYHPAYRQFPPEPVYSRLSWSHLPAPIQPKSRENAPLLMPTIVFDLPRSTLGEAVEALAQAMGYTWTYPESAKSRRIAIKMTASVDEIAKEIDRQAQVHTVLDNDSRMVRVVTPAMIDSGAGLSVPVPKLPESGS